MTAFTNPWDDTQPPDTQPANLLGADLRNLKIDIMQRMGGFGAGTLAARPTPDTGPADFTGVMYWATDTKQTFRWTGSAWVDISSNVGGGIVDYDNFTPFVYITAAPSNAQQITIPIGGVDSSGAVGSIIEIESSLHVSAFTGALPVVFHAVNLSGLAPIFAQVGPGVEVKMKSTIVLSNGTLPMFCSEVLTYNGGTTVSTTFVERGQLTAQLDGTAAIIISNGIANSTTVTAHVDYLHVRVRK